MMLSHRALYNSLDDTAVLIQLENGSEYYLACTPRQYKQGIEAYKNGALIQEAFPFLTAEEREFLMTGLTPAMWDRLFGNQD